MDNPAAGQRKSDSTSWVVCGESCGIRLQCRVEDGRKDIHVKIGRNQRRFAVQETALDFFIEATKARVAPNRGPTLPRQHPRTPNPSSSCAHEHSFLKRERPSHITGAVADYLWSLSCNAHDRLQREGLPLSHHEQLMGQLAQWLSATEAAASSTMT